MDNMKSAKKYKHTQIGWAMFVVAVAIAFVLPIFLPHSPKAMPGIYLVRVIAGAILLLFPTLSVEIDSSFIRFYFGLGVIGKKLALDDIASCRKLRTSWLNGWGIHGCLGKSWLYNVSGFDAIELVMKNGMKYYIGTDDPSGLLGAIWKPHPNSLPIVVHN